MDIETVATKLVKFGVTMFYMSFCSVIGTMLGWYDIAVPAVVFIIGLVSLYIGCGMISDTPDL